MLNNLTNFSVLGFVGLTGVNIYYKNLFPFWYKAFSSFTGIFLGGLFGVLISTKFTMKQLYKLGPEYIISSNIINQVEDYRLDKINKKYE